MKKTLLFLFAPALVSCHAFAGNWFGPSPWANSTYFPGNLDGKYQAAVTGLNTTGVLGFAIRDGAPPFLQSQTQTLASLNSGGSNNAIVANQQIDIDDSLNYYAVFVNGRTYVGTTAASINYDNNSVFGTLIGTQPSTITNTNSQIVTQRITNVTTTNLVTTNVTITNVGGLFVTNIVVQTNRTSISNIETLISTNLQASPVLIATGVDGGFRANITQKRNVFTFQGPGTLSSPGPIVAGTQVNPITSFNVSGIRVSFSSTANFQSLTPSTGTTVPQ